METTTSRAVRRILEGQWKKDARFILSGGRPMDNLSTQELIALARTIPRRKRALEEAETAKRMLMMLGSLTGADPHAASPTPQNAEAPLTGGRRENDQDDLGDDDFVALLADLE